ncbi:hypothetical protein KP509_16G013200 [Ceratopteris richardii]|uniref:Uncharacterized protein n=1 Tax=Ceratopteris richardii TaxID=49495 RepID=A0A8T2SXM9_CERRI|nr:hypothetical protein KP509_16G013200 [Ceratopteris richardii]
MGPSLLTTSKAIDRSSSGKNGNIVSCHPKAFEQLAQNAKMQALTVAGLEKLSLVVDIMGLIWAMALLGGFAKHIATWEFYLISCLLLLESFRLFVVHMIIKLLSFTLYREKMTPYEFEFRDKQPELINHLNILRQGFSGLIAVTSLCFISLRIFVEGWPTFLSENDLRNFVPSLSIFYIIVILTSVIACLSSLLHVLFRSIQKSNDTFQANKLSNSLAAYYDTVYRMSIEDGMGTAAKLELLDFGFTKLASDLKRNIRPLLVRTLNRDIISYLYENGGVAMARNHLNSDNLWKRTVAANLAGFWTEEQKIETQQDLFWSLQDIIFGGGLDAIAALNSLESLARFWSTNYNKGQPHAFLVSKPFENGGSVLNSLVKLVLMPTRSSVLFRIRAFEACCRDTRVREHLYQQSARHCELPMTRQATSSRLNELLVTIVGNHDEQGAHRKGHEEHHDIFSNGTLAQLCVKLAEIISPRSRARIVTKIYAARALMLLLLHGDENREDRAASRLKEWVDKAITITEKDSQNQYFVEADIEAAEKVRQWVDLPQLDWSLVRVVNLSGSRRDDRGAELVAEELDRIVSNARCSYEF